MVQLSNCILLTYCQIMKSYNPRSENLVWALPASLAATRGIEFSFSSYGYLDVSVPQVVFISLFYSTNDDWI